MLYNAPGLQNSSAANGMVSIEAVPAPAGGGDLEPLLARVENHLELLGEALVQRDADAIETHATELHRALVTALDGFAQAARQGPVPNPLRTRLAKAGGQVAIQRECLARATAALDRAIDAMMPRDASGVYSSAGTSTRLPSSGGSIQA